MRLRPTERDYYTLTIDVEPALVGDRQISVDGGTEWITGVEASGQWSWLIAGPDFDADLVMMDPDDTAATITETVTPLGRILANPVVDIEDCPRIILVAY